MCGPRAEAPTTIRLFLLLSVALTSLFSRVRETSSSRAVSPRLQASNFSARAFHTNTHDAPYAHMHSRKACTVAHSGPCPTCGLLISILLPLARGTPRTLTCSPACFSMPSPTFFTPPSASLRNSSAISARLSRGRFELNGSARRASSTNSGGALAYDARTCRRRWRRGEAVECGGAGVRKGVDREEAAAVAAVAEGRGAPAP